MKNIKSLLLIGSAVLLFASASFSQEKSTEKNPDKSKESETLLKPFRLYSGSTRVKDVNSAPVIHDLKLDKTEFTAECLKDEQQVETENVLVTNVFTDATDPENDVLTYVYEVSGGKIRGNREKVIWDLTGLEAGIYTIEVRVDDCCGLSADTITKTVTIKE